MEYVDGSIDISIVMGSATGAGPVAHVQGHVIFLVPATGAGLAGGSPSTDAIIGLAMPLALVFNHATQLTPRAFLYSPTYASILEHASHIQIFHIDGIVV